MKCPGQDSRNWEPGAIFDAACPRCGHEVEFFKDEASRKCRNCGAKVVNPKMDFGCASYCKFAAQCLGDLPPELAAQRENLLRERLAVEVKRRFKQDFRRIKRMLKVVRHAERIVKAEGGDPAVVLAAAYLNDTGGGDDVERTGGVSTAAQDEERLSSAVEILRKVGAGADLIGEIRRIIGARGGTSTSVTVNFKCLHDADLLVRLEEEQNVKPMSEEELESFGGHGFLTGTGRQVAREILREHHEGCGSGTDA